MRVGTTCPEGFLPVYSVDTEEEAKTLVILTTSIGPDGEYYAMNLAAAQTLEELEAFAQQVDRAHEFLKEQGRCFCREPVKRT